jgi:hypothetical protein
VTVRSRRLWAGRFGNTTGYWQVYATPDGTATIFKSLVAKNWDAAEQPLQVFVNVNGDAAFPAVYSATIGAGLSVNVEFYAVLHPGDRIVVQPSGSSMDIWLSGSELVDGVPTGPPAPPIPLAAAGALPTSTVLAKPPLPNVSGA